MTLCPLPYNRDFPEELHGASQPDLPHWTPNPSEPLCLDLILTRFRPDLSVNSGPNQAESRSKSRPDQVPAEGFGGGRCQRGRSSWNGPVAPRKVSTLQHETHNLFTACHVQVWLADLRRHSVRLFLVGYTGRYRGRSKRGHGKRRNSSQKAAQ